MRKVIDLTGHRFGRLTVIERAENKGKRVCWRCHCDCGNICIVRGYHLTLGKIKSCGCLQKEQRHNHLQHGMSHSPIYEIWHTIKQRCLNPNNKSYQYYGERGISIYTEWVENFQVFYDYVSQLPHFGEKGYSLDRIDNEKGYEPDNLRWATRKEQNCNQRRTIYVEYNGESITLVEASKISGIDYHTLFYRYRTGKDLFAIPNKHK